MTTNPPPASAASVEAMREALEQIANAPRYSRPGCPEHGQLAIDPQAIARAALSTPAEKPAGREAEIEQAARAISLSYGEDPDDVAPLGKICGPNNEPMPNWTAYREQAAAALSSFSTPAEAGREARKAAETAASTVISALGDPVKHDAAITAIAAQFEAFALARALSTTGRDAAAPTSGWQPIATAPKDGEYFLSWSADIGPVVCQFMNGRIETAWDGTPYKIASHWMPLPASPNATSQGGKE